MQLCISQKKKKKQFLNFDGVCSRGKVKRVCGLSYCQLATLRNFPLFNRVIFLFFQDLPLIAIDSFKHMYLFPKFEDIK